MSLSLKGEAGKPHEQVAAEITARGVVPVAGVLTAYSHDTFNSETSLQHAYEELERLSGLATTGDLTQVERLLSAQVFTLNAMFAGLAHRSQKNSLGGYLQASETYLRLALKAQSQCRQTAEALFEMKHPRPVAFVQQANIANGPQQVNNGTTPPRRARGKAQNAQTRLLEEQHGQRLDPGAQGAAGGTHQELATVGALNRSEDCGRQAGGFDERLPGWRTRAGKEAGAPDPLGAGGPPGRPGSNRGARGR